MNCKKIFDVIDSLVCEYIGVWKDVCNIESPTSYKKGVDEVGQYFARLADKFGWNVEVFEQKVSGNVICITMNKDAKNSPIAISAHIDTVHSVGSFGTPAVKILNGKIYGPGVMDCKGGAVAGIMAMHALQKSGFTDRPVKLLLQSDEENGSRTSEKTTINYICEKAKDCIGFLNLEGHEQYFDGKACLERKGILKYKFTITGQEVHASYCATEGANAIAEAAYKVIEIEKIKDAKGVTCNVGTIKGGTVSNTVAGECSFEVDIRFASEQQKQWIECEIQRIADKQFVKGCSTKLTKNGYRVAMELCDRNINFLNKINEIFRECGFSELCVGKRNGGSDAADVTTFGIPCVDSLGVKGEHAHSTEEEADIDSLAESAKRISSIIYYLQ